MSTEREASDINAKSATGSRGGPSAKVPARSTSRETPAAPAQPLQPVLNTQHIYQGGAELQANIQSATSQGMHIAGGSSSGGGSRPVPASFQHYAHAAGHHVQQQQGSMLMNTNTSTSGAGTAQTSVSMTNINTSTPCAACKLLRRRCAQECPFAPYFSPHEPHRFASVHKIYGASNVSKMLMEVPEIQRADAANSLVYEANARLRDPVYGCMGVVSALQQQAQALQAELNVVRGEVLRYRQCHVEVALHQHHQQQNPPSYSTPLSSTIAPHQKDRGHPLSIVADHYIRASGPSNLSHSTSMDDRDTKNCLMPWP